MRRWLAGRLTSGWTPIALFGVAFLLLLVPLACGWNRDWGELSVPLLVTDYWQAVVAAFYVGAFGFSINWYLRRREADSLLTMVACDAAQVADRSVLYRVQDHVDSVSKSRIVPVVAWEKLARLFDLVEDDGLKEFVFDFYERLERATPCFDRASEATLASDEAFFAEMALTQTRRELERHAPPDSRIEEVAEDKWNDKYLEGIISVAAARAEQRDGLVFLGPIGEGGVELLAEEIVTGCQRTLDREDEWYPRRRVNTAVEHLRKLEEILDSGDTPPRRAPYSLWHAFLLRHDILEDVWWRSSLSIPKRQCCSDCKSYENRGSWDSGQNALRPDAEEGTIPVGSCSREPPGRVDEVIKTHDPLPSNGALNVENPVCGNWCCPDFVSGAVRA